MQTITLRVTRKVLEQVKCGGETQRQIAITSPSPEILQAIAGSTPQDPAIVPIAGFVELAFVNDGAIWATHQKGDTQRQDFANLYSLLASHPDKRITLKW